MCGRYAITTNAEAIRRIFGTKGPTPNLRPRYNVAPTQDAPVVRIRDGERELAMLHWGLIPHWAKDTKIGYSTINARAETVEAKPAFRDAFRKRRCLVVADAFYEWQPREKGPKQPFAISMKDGGPFAMAGLWETWHEGEERIESFTIIVGEPNALIKPIHDRMPVILRSNSYDAWLSCKAGKELFKPYPAEDMQAVAISAKINSPKNEGPDAVVPVEARL